MEWLNKVSKDLNALIKKDAAAENFSYVDVTKLFHQKGKWHDVCEISGRWMNPLALTGPKHIESFHPNVDAHKVEGAMVLKCFNQPATCSPHGDILVKAM